MESIWISNIIHKHYQVGFAQQFKGDLFENILSGDIDAVELHSFVLILLIELDFLDMIFTALGHHVLMVKMLVNCLVNETSFTHSRSLLFSVIPILGIFLFSVFIILGLYYSRLFLFSVFSYSHYFPILA